jgi:predicted O-methyltransferase YrrM
MSQTLDLANSKLGNMRLRVAQVFSGLHHRFRYYEPIAIKRRVQGRLEAARRPIIEVPATIAFPSLRSSFVLVAPVQEGARFGDSDHGKLALICGIAKTIAAKRLLEIGTASGFMAAHLALNCGRDSRVWTVDLPSESISATHFIMEGVDREVSEKMHGNAAAGWYASQSKQRQQVVQIRSDSATFDFSGVQVPLDFAYIDGAHSYDYVMSDSLNVLPRMRPGGIVVWDDYDYYFPGVVEALGAINAVVKLIHLQGTAQVVATMPSDWCTSAQLNALRGLLSGKMMRRRR